MAIFNLQDFSFTCKIVAYAVHIITDYTKNMSQKTIAKINEETTAVLICHFKVKFPGLQE